MQRPENTARAAPQVVVYPRPFVTPLEPTLAPRTDPGMVLLVDDDPLVRNMVRRVLRREGHGVVEAGSRTEARELLDRERIDVVVLDLGLPDGNGLDTLEHVRETQQSARVLVLTGRSGIAHVDAALERGATSCLSKPADMGTLQTLVRVAMAQAREAPLAPRLSSVQIRGPASVVIDELPDELVKQLNDLWHMRHVETAEHVARIAVTTERLALHTGMAPDDAAQLGRMAILHDVGKLAIPDAILTKEGELTPEEFAVVQRHATLGWNLLSGFSHPSLALAATIARSHHERWDGSGYPDGLAGTDCPRAARIVAVADVYDALGHVRCYKDAWTKERILEYFRRERGRGFEEELVDALLDLIPTLDTLRPPPPTLIPSGPPSSRRG